MAEEIKTILLCLQCGQETEHQLTYRGQYIGSIVCQKCGSKIEMDKERLQEVFSEGFLENILSKPHEITEGMKKALLTLFPLIPRRLITEPYKVAKEIYEVLTKETEVKK